jgi:hypothetical protein
MREELPFTELVLQTLHNLCATAADLARPADEVASILQKDRFEIEGILDSCTVKGLTVSFVDSEGKKRYYLSPQGIINVCSQMT